MAVWSPLTTHFAVNTVDSSPRNSRVDSIGHHHTATNNKAVALSLFAPGGRTVTPNYFIAGKEVWGIVPEDRRAFTSGSTVDDSRSITYEILNSTNGPDWGFSAETLDTVARLDADISLRYGIRLQHSVPGFWEHKDLYRWFGRSYATACAGPSFSIKQVIAATAAIMNSTTPEDHPEEEETMPSLIARVDSGTRREWTLLDPGYGSDLSAGKQREEIVIDVNGNKHSVFIRRGMMVSTSPTVGNAWGRTYCRAFGNAPADMERTPYVEAQATGDLAGAEFQVSRRA